MSVITIRVEKGETTSGSNSSLVADTTTNTSTITSSNTEESSGFGTVGKQAVFATAALSIGKSGFNFLVANYGNLTNDYVGEVQLQEKLDFMGSVSGIAAGFAFGGVAGGILATTAVAISYATNFASSVIKTQRQNAEKELLRQRYGIINSGGGRS